MRKFILAVSVAVVLVALSVPQFLNNHDTNLTRKVNEYEGQHIALTRKVNEYEGQHLKVNEYEGQHRKVNEYEGQH